MKDAILVTRKINCADIDEATFVKAITEDMQTAYNIVLEHDIKKFQNEIINKKNKVIDYANERYKRAADRNKYIEKEFEKIEKYNNPDNVYHSFTFADFDVRPDELGIPMVCCISMDRLDKVNLCYENVKDNEYFKKITGWQIVNSMRPEFKFETDPETKADMNKRVSKLVNELTEYYNDCTTYFGD